MLQSVWTIAGINLIMKKDVVIILSKLKNINVRLFVRLQKTFMNKLISLLRFWNFIKKLNFKITLFFQTWHKLFLEHPLNFENWICIFWNFKWEENYTFLGQKRFSDRPQTLQNKDEEGHWKHWKEKYERQSGT